MEREMAITRNMHLEVRPLTVGDASTCDQILLTLPRHFGHEGGRQACAQAVRTSEGWVAVFAGRVVGFLTVQSHGATTVEITWMAVQADLRGQGIGRRLIERLRQEMQARAFYQRVGFLAVCEVPLYWGVGSDPALLLVMPL